MQTEHRMYAGIDFSKNQAHFALQQEDGRPLEKHRAFANNLDGYQEAKTFLLKVLQEQEIHALDIAGEATSYYWLPMYIQFYQDPDFAKYDFNLYLLNARWVHWFKKSQSPHHKTDEIDPGDIAAYIRFNPPATTWKYDSHWLPLQFYTRLRFHLAKSLTREKNLFQLYLFLRYNTFSQRRPFSDPLGVTSQNLLADAEQLDRLCALSCEELAHQLDQLAKHHLPNPLRTASRLQHMLTESFPLDDALVDPIQDGLELLLATIQHLQAQIKRVEEKVIALVTENYPEVAWLSSIPGVGLVTASGVAAEIGDLNRFSLVPVWDSHHKIYRQRKSREVVDAVHKYAGLWWPRNASGQFEAEEHHLSREGNAYLRYYVFEAADSLRQRIPSFKAYYQLKFDQTKIHKHKRALILTGCKALDLFVTLLRRREVYQAKEGLAS